MILSADVTFVVSCNRDKGGEAVVFYLLRRYFVQLRDTNRCSLSHIGVLIAQSSTQWLAKILADLLHPMVLTAKMAPTPG